MRLFNTAQPLLRMRGTPEFHGWAERVVALADEPELACVKEVLDSLATNHLQDLAPINDYLANHAESIQPQDLWRASERVEKAISEEPYSALLASTVVLMFWSVSREKQLYQQFDGMPEPGWGLFPYVCAKAALKTGAVDEALHLVERGMDVLNAAKYTHYPAYQSAVRRYRELGISVEARWRSGIENLAVDLRDSCRVEQPNFRAEVGALLWTLGMIPESSLFAPSKSYPVLPPLRICRQIVLVSHIGMGGDPLTQYIWLEMKDREPFNIRDHPVFFGSANLVYHNNPGDDLPMPKQPSQVFAKTIIAWFRGDLDKQLARDYLESCELVEAMFPDKVYWHVYFRMVVLAAMVAEKFGWLQETQAQVLEKAQSLVNQAASLNRNAFLHPAWPHLYTRTTGPIFFLLDRFAAASAPPSASLSALEGFRAASMDYWLAVAPPTPSAREEGAAADLIAQENALLADLKGAYFMILAPILPMHYRRSARVLTDDPSSAKYPDTSKGLDHYKRIRGELSRLHTQMQDLAPSYARWRTSPIADLASFAAALGMHRTPENAPR